MPREDYQQGLNVQLEMLGYCLCQVQMTLKTGVGQSVCEGRAERAERPKVGVKRKAKADSTS